jgi:hypothetical protein
MERKRNKKKQVMRSNTDMAARRCMVETVEEDVPMSVRLPVGCYFRDRLD